MLAISLLLISSVPLSSAETCDMPGMAMGKGSSMLVEPAIKQVDLQGCYFECSCHVDNHIDGMPYQLAPYALFLSGLEIAPTTAVNNMAIAPALTARLLFPPSPPPIIS